MSQPPAARVLIVDDDPQVSAVLDALLGQAGIETLRAASGAEALVALDGPLPVDAVISDLQMPEMDGIALLQQIVARWPGLPVLLLTGFGTIPLAVEAMKCGAADFMLKPFKNHEILYCVRKALARAAETDARPEELPVTRRPYVSVSGAMAQVEAMIGRAAPGSATVLIRGESGTGKELAARALHDQSGRAGPFVKFHCAALPDGLLESELFGYEKGAFTGAAHRKPGRVELSEGGTLFLDEIGDVPLAMQVKLLRLLQDREFERLGGTTSYKANVRFVAATHRPLEAMIGRGEFREDLFYRLSVVPIRLPPLRERPEDIGPLAEHFCRVFGEANRRREVRLHPGCHAALAAFSWPGNVRQLQNVIERLVILSTEPVLSRAAVEAELGQWTTGADAPPELRRRRGLELDEVRDALVRAGGNRTLAARLLGVSRRTLYNKLAEFKLA